MPNGLLGILCILSYKCKSCAMIYAVYMEAFTMKIELIKTNEN